MKTWWRKFEKRLPLKWQAYLATGFLAGVCVWHLYTLWRELRWDVALNVTGLALQWFGLGWIAMTYYAVSKRKKFARIISAEPHDVVFLSNAEMEHINSHKTCPDCAVGGLLPGPRGGCSINMKCANCGHEFNLAQHLGHFVFGNRIDRDEPALYPEMEL